jgi:hypothetical protein
MSAMAHPRHHMALSICVCNIAAMFFRFAHTIDTITVADSDAVFGGPAMAFSHSGFSRAVSGYGILFSIWHAYHLSLLAKFSTNVIFSAFSSMRQCLLY